MTTTSTPVRIIEHDIDGFPQADDLVRLPAPLTNVLTMELDGAQRDLGVSTEEILLAALGLTIARTIGTGVAPVDVAQEGGWCTIVLACAPAQAVEATQLLRGVHTALAASHGNGAGRAAEISFSHLGTGPGHGHVLELRVYRAGGLLQMDWWYDLRRLDSATVHELTEQFPFALIQVTSEATAPIHEAAHLICVGQ